MRLPCPFSRPCAEPSRYDKKNPHVRHGDMLEASRVYDLITDTTTQSTTSFYQLFLYKNNKDESIFTPRT